jgi:hypothetical protein
VFPKPPKARNKKVIEEIRNEGDDCEYCGGQCGLIIEVCHIVRKGPGGPDIRENLLRMGGPAGMGIGCHGADHRGEIQQEELLAIVAEREGITPDECYRRIRLAMGYAV